MRLFIAINLDDNIKEALVEMQESMRRQGVRGNYTKIENLHLTLAFIGEYGDPDAVNEALASVPLEPFRLALRGYGSFGNLYWAGLEDSDKLSAYVKRLRRALAEREIPFDRKIFPAYHPGASSVGGSSATACTFGVNGSPPCFAHALRAWKKRYDLYGDRLRGKHVLKKC